MIPKGDLAVTLFPRGPEPSGGQSCFWSIRSVFIRSYFPRREVGGKERGRGKMGSPPPSPTSRHRREPQFPLARTALLRILQKGTLRPRRCSDLLGVTGGFLPVHPELSLGPSRQGGNGVAPESFRGALWAGSSLRGTPGFCKPRPARDVGSRVILNLLWNLRKVP